jgi:hypothetical protein
MMLGLCWLLNDTSQATQFHFSCCISKHSGFEVSIKVKSSVWFADFQQMFQFLDTFHPSISKQDQLYFKPR